MTFSAAAYSVKATFLAFPFRVYIICSSGPGKLDSASRYQPTILVIKSRLSDLEIGVGALPKPEVCGVGVSLYDAAELLLL